MQHTSLLELEQEISRMTRAMTARNSLIGQALLADLQTRFSLEEVAGLLLVSLERVIWLDANAFVWAVESLLPADILREIRQITTLTVSKRLISKGMVPGMDFSVDSKGKLLLSEQARSVALG